MDLFNRKKINEKRVKGPEDFTKVMKIADPLANKLIDKGLGDFLLSEFVFDKSKYVLDKKDVNTVTDSIRPILGQILGYLKLPLLVDLNVNFTDDVYKFNQKFRAGEYRNEWSLRRITLNFNMAYSLENVIAILCHECSHYFMDYHSLNDYSEPDLYEIRNDVMCCLLGFYKELRDGYKESYVGKNIFAQGRLKIGYINSYEAIEVRDYRIYKRDKLRTADLDKEMTLRLKDKLSQLLSVADKFCEQLKERDPLTHVDDYRDVDAEGFKDLQTAIMGYQDLDVRAVDEIRKDMDTDDISKLEEDIRRMEKYCEKTQAILNVFNKYGKNGQ